VARAINAASGSRPVVVLANLSGPIVFCVVSRYHGGAFVVFSSALNDGLERRRSRGPSPR
jgi:hypothetical protein